MKSRLLSCLVILTALLSVAAVAKGIVFGSQVILVVLLGLMAAAFVKGFNIGGH